MLAVNKFFNNKYNKILLTHFVDNNVASGLYLATGEFLDMIDALNTEAYTTGFTSAKGNLLTVVSGLFNRTITAQNMLDEGHIDDVTGIEVRKFSGYNASYKTTTYNDTDGAMKIVYTQPLSISPRLTKLPSSDLYLVFFGPSTCTYYKPIDGSQRTMTSYIAFSVTEQGQGGDIELDHTDIIDYLDAFEIQIALPKEIA